METLTPDPLYKPAAAPAVRPSPRPVAAGAPKPPSPKGSKAGDPALDPADPRLLAKAEAGAEGEAPPEELPVHRAAGFMNQPWVQNVLPLATSLFLHVTIIVIGIALYQAVKQAVNPNKEQVIIPESSMAKTATPGGIPHPGLGGDPTRDAAQMETKDTQDDSFNTSPSNNLQAAAGGGSGDDASSFEGASAASGKGHGTGAGSGSAFGSGTGGGAAPWGQPGGGGGMLPKSNFMGTGGNASDVVYLCDASGSMLKVFGQLKQELKKSISDMSVSADGAQRFDVIFFSDDNVFSCFKKAGMQIATPENKAIAMDFIDNQVTAGGTQPIPAIKAAMAERPQLVYVLTDGFDQIANFDDVINAFKDGNKDGKMHINCIYLQSDNPDPTLLDVLKKISDGGHGDLKVILEKDM